MKRIDEQLSRLFRAVRSTDDYLVPAIPFGLETRVLAAWRESHRVEFWDAALLRRALIFAGIVMVLSFWPVLQQAQATNPFSESLQLADSDSAAQADFTP